MRKLFDFVRSIFGSVSKSDAELDFQESISGLTVTKDTIFTYRMLNVDSSFKSPEAQTIIKAFYNTLNHSKTSVRLSMDKNFLLDLLTMVENVLKNADTLNKMFKEFKNEEIATAGLSVYQMNLLRAVPHYSFLDTYSTELVNYLLTYETKVVNKRWVDVPKATVNQITGNIRAFVILLAVYGDDPSKFEARMKALPKSILSTKDDERVDTYSISVKDDIAANLPEGFIGSPIYSIRSAIATWQADRYARRQEMKKLLEMRIVEMRSLLTGGEKDASIEEEIQYLQNRINAINAKLAKVEDSIK